MTGGIIPLAVTLATNAVFDSFIGDSKVLSFFWKTFFYGLGRHWQSEIVVLFGCSTVQWLDYHIDITDKFYKLGTSGKSLTLSDKMPSSY